MVAAFKAATGTDMNVFSESFEDVQPKASVAANTGQGMDLAWGLHTLPQLFPTKVIKLNDVADYLGKKYGGWTDAAAATCKQGNDWLGIPVATIGGYMTYRKSALEKAGFKEFPKDFPGFLEMCKGLKKNNTPAGFALGHASGDANAWLHWILWGHGAYTVDKDDKVIINSPETVKALEYAKAVSDNFIPGVASWNDGSNNKAYLAGELYCTANGISIYIAAKDDAAKKEMAEDTYHALWPVGPIGKPTELQLCVPILAFKFTKYPNAAKAFIAFMLEKENFDKWLSGARGYLTHTLKAYDKSPIWTADPKNEVFSHASERALPASGIGHPGEKAATAIADFLVVDMFANYCTGREDAKGAITMAERQLKRIYR
jgi:multiple sugar transport system substrate-binding protein